MIVLIIIMKLEIYFINFGLFIKKLICFNYANMLKSKVINKFTDNVIF